MVERTDDDDALPAEVLEEVEDYARTLVHAGFTSSDDIVRDLVDHFDDEHPVTPPVARSVVRRVWRERAAEQEGWPERTDVDRLFAVFDALDRAGIVARADFTCCQTCGHAEIGDEAGEDARGYVFFHRQDTESAVAGGGVWLAYGSFGDEADLEPVDHAAADEAVGREVVAALAAGGLPVEWNGSARTRIQVGPIAWQKRLPVA
ncbi:hypothetical protein IOD16_37280 [Saccharothrix sp. 6-C]|uniref:DUF6891 domain-containing protein n=1 Tax=Saccharothrix texasensis TaxID=103734 RepID=A0A3N1H9I0_9PSEU|nr:MULTISPECIES: hypothetical protein [Saccharothrix]QQQ76579.1 hypothetical protein IOD16_37280 [Saccharothrix sp. 6-C]ROP39185.1 hypothetical protein EDD40_4564 [Saccharothrix texasensis]